MFLPVVEINKFLLRQRTSGPVNAHLMPGICSPRTGTEYLGTIMLTSPCNVVPLTPQFYIVKLGFTGLLLRRF